MANRSDPAAVTSFFSTLSPQLQASLERSGQPASLRSGEVLIEQGGCDSTLYLLQSGTLAVHPGPHQEGPVISIEAGEVVGEMAFLDNRPRTATVIASSDCTVVALERQATFQRLSDHPLELHELITGLANLQRSRLHEEAVSDARQHAEVVEALACEARNHRAVRHPFLQALAEGDLPDGRSALVDFARHYYGYSAHFPRYLTALISRLERADHRASLLENLTEESGRYAPEELAELERCGIEPQWIVGIPHPELFQRFRRALGVPNTAAADDHIEVVCWREMFLSLLTNGSPAEALGALGLGTETIVQSIYRPFVTAIARLGSLAPEDTVFFPLHTAVDDHHQATLRAIAADFATTPEGRMDLAKGMRKALALRDSFWCWLHERALEPRP